MDGVVLSAIIGSVLGSQVLVALAQGWFNRRKTGAEAASLLLEKTLEWASKLTARIEKLEADVALKDGIIAGLQERIVHLENR